MLCAWTVSSILAASLCDYRATLSHNLIHLFDDLIKASKAQLIWPPCKEVTSGSDVSVLLKNTSAGQMFVDSVWIGAIQLNDRLINCMQTVYDTPTGLGYVFKSVSVKIWIIFVVFVLFPLLIFPMKYHRCCMVSPTSNFVLFFLMLCYISPRHRAEL